MQLEEKLMQEYNSPIFECMLWAATSITVATAATKLLANSGEEQVGQNICR